MSSDQNLIAMNMKYGTESVEYFYKQGKLTQEQFQEVSSLIKSLFKVINESQKNSNTLNQTMKILKKQLSTIKQQHEFANNRQAQVTQITQKLLRAFKKAESEYEIQKTKYEGQIYDAENREKQVMNARQRMQENIRYTKQRMQPIIEHYNSEIEKTKQMNEKTRNYIEGLHRDLEENMQKIKTIQMKNVELHEQEQKLKQHMLKIKDSPDHYAKSAQNLHMEIIGMQNELKQTKQEIERKTKICQTFEEKNKSQEEQIERLEKEKEDILQQTQQIKHETEQLRNQNYIIDSEKEQIKIDIMTHVDLNINQIKSNIKNTNEIINEYKKECEKLKKAYKKEMIKKKQYEEFILETQMVTEKIKKQQALVQSETQELFNRAVVMKDDILLVNDKTQNIKLKSTNNEGKKKEIQIEIRKMENTLTELKKIVSNINKEIKDSTAVRESMARKASVANTEVRQTQQELKVKELLILDLTKKQEETQNKLQHFKALYEEVKSARNKYVNLIQNSSQDLAELKERIKILQNQLQILKNQSSQKHKTIQDYNHIKQLQIHKRDQTKAKLNQYELEKKQTKQLVDQNINEIEKLNMIILSLQKDMQNLRLQYEEACQNRNYTGIQLIDRNDELCILYEKSNVQENILRKSQVAVKNLEDDIRMISIEINQFQRKIIIGQEKLSSVPKLAQKLLELQKYIQQTHQKENQLSGRLEDPSNKDRWRELGGQDPDEEALDAKISILEERLNSKKQQLLEKELILDEVTNLSEKLKKDAVDGRQSTLQVSQKINQFQSRLRDLTRKMKATISQLSMCQANIIKYQSERDELQTNHEQAKKRMQEGLPPTPETEIQYLKMIRDKKRYEEEKNIRKQKQILEMNYPPYVTKTTAQARHNSYIPPDQIGLPKPYGNNAPFMFNQPGANMRHFKKPKVKEIQI